MRRQSIFAHHWNAQPDPWISMMMVSCHIGLESIPLASEHVTLCCCPSIIGTFNHPSTIHLMIFNMSIMTGSILSLWFPKWHFLIPFLFCTTSISLWAWQLSQALVDFQGATPMVPTPFLPWGPYMKVQVSTFVSYRLAWRRLTLVTSSWKSAWYFSVL